MMLILAHRLKRLLLIIQQVIFGILLGELVSVVVLWIIPQSSQTSLTASWDIIASIKKTEKLFVLVGVIVVLKLMSVEVGLEKIYHRPAACLSRKQWQQVTRSMAVGLYNAIMLYPVAEIVLGGGIASKQAWTLPLIEEELNKLLNGFRTVQISPSKFAADNNLYGALAIIQ